MQEPPYKTDKHPNCKCLIVPMRTKKLGHVTEDRFNGADVYIACLGKLPDNYVTKAEAKKAKWKNQKGNLAEVLPGKMIGGGIYKNADHKRLDAPVAFGMRQILTMRVVIATIPESSIQTTV